MQCMNDVSKWLATWYLHSTSHSLTLTATAIVRTYNHFTCIQDRPSLNPTGPCSVNMWAPLLNFLTINPKTYHEFIELTPVKGLCDSTSIRLRRKMNMFMFCRVKRRRTNQKAVARQFIRTQEELNDSSTVVYLFQYTGSFTCCQVTEVGLCSSYRQLFCWRYWLTYVSSCRTTAYN